MVSWQKIDERGSFSHMQDHKDGTRVRQNQSLSDPKQKDVFSVHQCSLPPGFGILSLW